jgi:hypothetical protein
MKIYGLAVVIFLHSGYNIPNAIFLHDIRKGGSMAHREKGHPDTKDVPDPSSRPKKECAEPMKKSCLIAVIATLAAIAGALAAVAVYLRRREKELDEYERLLFGEDKAEPADAPAEDAAEE